MVAKLNQKMDVMNRRLPTWEALHQQTQQQEKILQQVLLILQHTPITHGPADITAPVQQHEPIQLTVPQTLTFIPTNVITFDISHQSTTFCIYQSKTDYHPTNWNRSSTQLRVLLTLSNT